MDWFYREYLFNLFRPDITTLTNYVYVKGFPKENPLRVVRIDGGKVDTPVLETGL